MTFQVMYNTHDGQEHTFTTAETFAKAVQKANTVFEWRKRQPEHIQNIWIQDTAGQPTNEDQTRLRRYYTDYELTVLCEDCAAARKANGEFIQWAETPADWELAELVCYDCDATVSPTAE
jgi:hypothetical protein